MPKNEHLAKKMKYEPQLLLLIRTACVFYGVQHTLLLQITYANVFCLKENFILFTMIKNVIFSTTTEISVIYSKGRLER